MTSTAPALGLSARPVALLAALFLGMLAVRPQLLAIGPLLPEIQDDLAISHAEAGLLTTIPVICMGLFAPLGPRLAGRLGVRWAVALCLGLIAAFAVLRGIAPGAVLVVALTFGLGLSMGMIGPLPAFVIKQRIPHIPGLATGAYSTGIVAGSTIAAAVAVPLAAALGGWRAALIAIGVVGITSLVAWIVLVAPDPPRAVDTPRPSKLPWRRPIGWLLIVLFGLQSMLYYGVVSWLPDAYVERGWTAADAANLIAVMHLVGLVAGLVVPLLADRVGSRRVQLGVVSAIATAGMLGVVLLPDLAAVWMVAVGIGLGGIFPLVLVLPVDVAERPSDVGATAALMLFGGYTLSGTAPLILGSLRDATGDFSASLWLLVILGAGLVACTALLSPALLGRGIKGFPTPSSA